MTPTADNMPDFYATAADGLNDAQRLSLAQSASFLLGNGHTVEEVARGWLMHSHAQAMFLSNAVKVVQRVKEWRSDEAQ